MSHWDTNAPRSGSKVSCQSPSGYNAPWSANIEMYHIKVNERQQRSFKVQCLSQTCLGWLIYLFAMMSWSLICPLPCWAIELMSPFTVDFFYFYTTNNKILLFFFCSWCYFLLFCSSSHTAVILSCIYPLPNFPTHPCTPPAPLSFYDPASCSCPRASNRSPMGVLFSPMLSSLFSSLFFRLRSLTEAWTRTTVRGRQRQGEELNK